MSDNAQQGDLKETTEVRIDAYPALNNELKEILEKIRHSTSLWSLKDNTNILANELFDKYDMSEMLLKVEDKQLDEKLAFNQDRPDLKYKLAIYPKFKHFGLYHQLQDKSWVVGSKLNLLAETVKSVNLQGQWKFWISQLSVKAIVSRYSSWKAMAELKYGKPLDQKWVTDCRKFRLSKAIDSQSQSDQKKSEWYLETKGYQNRLARMEVQMPQIYKNRKGLHVIDVVESGYKIKGKLEHPMLSYTLKGALGASYHNQTVYTKLKAGASAGYFIKPQKWLLTLEGKICHTQGKNLIPHEMFSRNSKKWMGDRSQSYVNVKSKLISTQGVLPTFRIHPYNYVSFWVSRNRLNQVKLQSEVGIGLLMRHAFVDIPLLQMSGQIGKPRLGFKFGF